MSTDKILKQHVHHELQKNLRFEDCVITANDDGDEILECKLRRGKTKARDVIATGGAVSTEAGLRRQTET